MNYIEQIIISSNGIEIPELHDLVLYEITEQMTFEKIKFDSLSDFTNKPFDIKVNLVPDDEGHMFLNEMIESRESFDITLTFVYSNGYSESTTINGLIFASKIEGDKYTMCTRSHLFLPSTIIIKTKTK